MGKPPQRNQILYTMEALTGKLHPHRGSIRTTMAFVPALRNVRSALSAAHKAARVLSTPNSPLPSRTILPPSCSRNRARVPEFTDDRMPFAHRALEVIDQRTIFPATCPANSASTGSAEIARSSSSHSCTSAVATPMAEKSAQPTTVGGRPRINLFATSQTHCRTADQEERHVRAQTSRDGEQGFVRHRSFHTSRSANSAAAASLLPPPKPGLDRNLFLQRHHGITRFAVPAGRIHSRCAARPHGFVRSVGTPGASQTS